MTDAEMSKLVAQLESELGVGWVDVVEWLRSQNSLDDITAALKAGRFNDVVTGITEAATRFAGDVHGAYNTAALRAREWLDTKVPDALINYDQTNTRAVQWAAQNKLDLRGQITRDQEDTIRSVIVRGQQDGINPIEQARDIRQAIGLTAYQEGIVHNYRRELESGDYMSSLDRQLLDGRHARAIESAAAGRRSFSPDDVDRMVDNYRQAWIGYRAETIARTEGLRAAHEGTDELYQQAIDAGQVDARELEMTWVSGPPSKDARPGHQALNEVTAPMGGVFTNPITGAKLRFPGDPEAPIDETANCRCGRTVRYIPSTGEASARPEVVPHVQEEPVRVAPRAATPEPAPAPEPIAPAPAPEPAISERTRAAAALTTDRATALKPVGDGVKGVNSSYWMELDGSVSGLPRTAVWKPQSGEAAEMRPHTITDGTSYLREAAAYNVAETLGVADMVPATVVRTFETTGFREVALTAEEQAAQLAAADPGWGDAAAVDFRRELIPDGPNTLPKLAGFDSHQGLTGVGSLQEKIEGKGVYPNLEFSQDGAERMRVFDFVTGNSDRHDKNVLVRNVDGKQMPVLIDNGLSFPNGPPERFIQPSEFTEQYHRPMLDTTLKQIADVDLDKLATQLKDSGIERSAVEGALQRAQALKNQPRMLEVTADTKRDKDLVVAEDAWEAMTGDQAVVRLLTLDQRRQISVILSRLFK